jgi:hypothetical protein
LFRASTEAFLAASRRFLILILPLARVIVWISRARQGRLRPPLPGSTLTVERRNRRRGLSEEILYDGKAGATVEHRLREVMSCVVGVEGARKAEKLRVCGLRFLSQLLDDGPH